jgi:phosphatidylserine/phosphatidylglycerophosphate/cardiolipin synthase-like enzyme
LRTPLLGDGIRVRAIAGTNTVLLAFDATEKAREGLLGFAIHRATPDVEKPEAYWLKGTKVFESVEPNPPQGSRYTTLEHPIQSFIWGDYTASPDTRYVYTIRPVYGRPKKLDYGDDIEFEVRTEKEFDNQHGVWFNRGAVASQAYSQQYGNQPPPAPDDHRHEQTKWLARGLLDACLRFIEETPPGDALRVAAYEFTYAPILRALKHAIGRGVDVMVVYEAGQVREEGELVDTDATVGNRKAIERHSFPAANLIQRTRRAAIPHNKFIVRITGDTPSAVFTGSANFTESGFLGQTNVGHQVNDPAVAAKFAEYWEYLADDPSGDELEPRVEALTPHPSATLPAGTTCVFSPRGDSSMLQWYAEQIRGAEELVLYAGGFGLDEKLALAIAEERDFLRYLLLEKPPRTKTKALLGNDPDLITVFGSVLGEVWVKDKHGELTIRREIPGFELERWYLNEEHWRKRGNIFFMHAKLLMIDVLSDTPLIFTGSANFSTSSLNRNDENMLLIRGDTRVADIYLTEYDRILRHFQFRDIAAEANGKGREAKFLDEKGKWLRPYFEAGQFKDRRRRMFFTDSPRD